MLDVHQQQLLMLLLVVQAELDERGSSGHASASQRSINSSIAASTCAR